MTLVQVLENTSLLTLLKEANAEYCNLHDFLQRDYLGPADVAAALERVDSVLRGMVNVAWAQQRAWAALAGQRPLGQVPSGRREDNQ